MKKIIVFGATGKTGRRTVRHAIQKNHTVTAFGRSVNKVDFDKSVAKVQGDILEQESVANAIEGQDCVIVCLGAVNLKDQTTLSTGAKNIVWAMKKHNIERIIFISAAGVGESWKQIPWYSKLLFSTLLKTIIKEHAKEEKIFRESGLLWTAVRAAILTDKEISNKVIASNSAFIKTITREALASFLVNQVSSSEFIKSTVSVAQR